MAFAARSRRLGARSPDRAEPRHVGDGWDRSGERPTKVITGRAGRRAAPAADDARRPPPRRRARRPSSSARAPSAIMAWAFALGLLLILIAITTADAATL